MNEKQFTMASVVDSPSRFVCYFCMNNIYNVEVAWTPRWLNLAEHGARTFYLSLPVRTPVHSMPSIRSTWY